MSGSATASLTFSSSNWRARLEGYGWSDFESLWHLEADEVEPANVRRGGWSSVVRAEAPDGAAFYLKRQENHDFREWRGGLKSAPTVSREWRAIEDFRSLGIGTAEPVCLGAARAGASRGLLMTAALDDYRSLSEVLQQDHLALAERHSLWSEVAACVLKMHEGGYRHNCLYGQHVLVQRSSRGWEVRLIDLEKARLTRNRRRAAISDLSALDRHTDDMSQRDRHWFWDRYFEGSPPAFSRRVLLPLARRTAVRSVRHYLADRTDRDR